VRRARLMIGVMAALWAGACASGGQTMADRFVTQGTPTVDLGGPRLVSSRASKAKNPLKGTAINNVASRTSGTMSAVEGSNPELRDALFRVLLAPTAAHHMQVASAYRKIGIFDNAYDYLARSLTLNGADPAVHDAMARLWRDWGNPGTGLSHAYQAVSMAPEWPVAQNTLGTLLFTLGHRGDARTRFETAVRLDPTAAYALDNLCTLHMVEGRTREAISVCRQAKAARHARAAIKTSPESR
jgi:Flp pilus assembly protein TadD